MHSDRQLMKISLIMAIVGIAGLGVLAYYIEPPELPISSIADDAVGRMVKITGTVSDYSKTKEAVFFSVSDSTGVIKVVVFKKSPSYGLELDDADAVSMTGKISLYKNAYEITAESVKKV